MSWTDAKIERLKELWTAGWSCSQIGRDIDKSRNAVIGKAHRMGLEARAERTATEIRDRRRQRRRARKSVLAVIAPRSKAAEPLPAEPVMPVGPAKNADGLPVTLMDLTSETCRWPIGDPGTEGFHFCGHKPFAGTPYCAYHARVAYNPR